MAFSDLCHIGKVYKTVENETDQSERIMEENPMVRDLITKILDDTGPTEESSSLQSPEKALSGMQGSYPKNDTSSYVPPSYNTYQNNLYSFSQNDQNCFNNFNMQNGFGNTNGFVNYADNDVTALLGIDPVPDTSADSVTPEQLNLLRLAAQEIGGAQFTSPNKFDDKYYNFFEPNQRNSLQETNMFPVTNYTRPNSLNLDINFNSNYDYNAQRFPNNFKDQNQDNTEILSYLNQLNISLDRGREENVVNNMDFKMPLDLNGHYPEQFNKNAEEQSKMFFNRSYQQAPPSKSFGESAYYDMMSQMNDRSPINQNFDYSNQTAVSAASAYKPNGFHQGEFVPRRELNQMIGRDNFQGNSAMNEQRTNFDNVARENLQQAAMMRQNQELARHMNLLMRNRPPPGQLNVEVSFLHDNPQFNIGPSPPVPQPVLPSPMLDLPLLAPFYAMRNVRGAATSSSILHGRLDACYEQWRQLERERKRTEARLALAYPGRAVSSSNSIPVPRLPPCPTRVDRLTVDMLREHTKVLTLMGKMETLRASVTVAQNKKPNRPEDGKITVLKRGQENVVGDKDPGLDPGAFDPSTWRDDLKHLPEIAPHSEVESAMLAWRSAVGAVQAARRRELAPHHHHQRYPRSDPILQLADAVKQLSISARRARCAMWCDLTLTVAMAPDHQHHQQQQQVTVATTNTTATSTPAQASPVAKLADICANENAQPSSQPSTPTKQPAASNSTTAQSTSKQTTTESKEEKPPATENTKPDAKPEAANKPTANKQTDKHDKSRNRNQYRKLNQGRSDFYQKNQRYDARFMHSRPPYHYLATGPIN